MRLRFTIAVAILTAIVPLADIARAADVTEGRVTFQRDVLRILAKHCQNCHRPGQVAPMSFLTYETTRPWARQIKAVVTVKKMPPGQPPLHGPDARRGIDPSRNHHPREVGG